MSTIKPTTFKFKQGDLDPFGKTIQLLNTVHRVALMGNTRPRSPAAATQFGNPTDPTFIGFGIDGQHYEGGVAAKTWREKDSIDDFTDKVTDPVRWAGTDFGPNLAEGGIDFGSDPPFGLRLYARYAGSGLVENWDRVGLMSCANPAGGLTPALSTRITTIFEGAPIGVNLETCALLGLQQGGSDLDYVFAGYVNTLTYPFSVVMGEVVAGVATVFAVHALPSGTTSVSICIAMDRNTNTYRGWYSNSLKGEDCFAPPWVAMAAPQANPAGWPSAIVPRFHASLGAATPEGTAISFSDCRSESGTWIGDAQASWFLEVLDVSNPVDMTGAQDVCPNELMCVWERGQGGQCHLTLLDMDDNPPVGPSMWRRWKDIGIWEDWNREDEDWWSPGWLDADEGHIVMTRHTKAQASGSGLDGRGEVWIFSLRWDAVIVLHTNGIGSLLAYEDLVTNVVLRESGTWGARRWVTHESFQDLGNYDQAHQPTTPWVGTLAKNGTEALVPALTYGVHVRKLDDDSIGLAYGIQEIPAVFPGQGKCYAGTIKLEEGATRHYERKLFRKSPAGIVLWEHSDEAWVHPRLTYSRALYWLQGKEGGGFDEIEGVLSRADTTIVAADNLSTAFYSENDFWSFVDGFGGMGFQLWIEDNVIGGHGEVILAVTGWMANSWLTAMWYDAITPTSSEIRTFSGGAPVEGINDFFDRRHPFNEFPRWIQYQSIKDVATVVTHMTDAELEECRLDMGAYVGESGYPIVPTAVNPLEPSPPFPTISTISGILQRMKWTGVGAVTRRHIMMKPRAIAPGDFAIEWEGKLTPPWSAGYGFAAIQSMFVAQSGFFRVGVLGSKRHKISVMIGWQGQFGLPTPGSGMYVIGTASWLQSTGLQSHQSNYTPNILSTLPGSIIKMKITRKGKVWKILFWESSIQDYVTVLEVAGLDLPVVPFFETLLVDGEGLATSAAIEWTRMELAPPGDSIGSQHLRAATHHTLSKVLGEVASGGSVRERPILKTGGALIIGDAFAAPGLMPR